jgi:hypothetical protein
MAIHINVVCDHDGCKLCQSIGFEQFEETWGDLIKALYDAGWKLDIEEEKVIKAFCPEHK